MLRKARVSHGVVGGYAVALHGAARGTMDVFLDEFRHLHTPGRRSRLITMHVPERMLEVFRRGAASRARPSRRESRN